MDFGNPHLVQGAFAQLTALVGWGRWLLPAWPALAFGLVGAAHLLGLPRLLGKGQAGKRSPAMTLLLLPYLSVLWLGLRASARGPAWVEVADGLYLGRHSRFDEMPPGVDLVVDLSAEVASDPRVVAGRTYLSVPTLEGAAPPPAALEALVESAAGWSGRVLIHCARGGGRSALVMACVMVQRGLSSDVDAALAGLRGLWPGARLSAAQRRAVSSGGPTTELPEAI